MSADVMREQRTLSKPKLCYRFFFVCQVWYAQPEKENSILTQSVSHVGIHGKYEICHTRDGHDLWQ